MSTFNYVDADQIVRRYALLNESRYSPPVASSRLSAVVVRCGLCTIGVPTIEKRGDPSRPGRSWDKKICYNCHAPWTPTEITVDSGGTTYDPRRVERRMMLDLDEAILLTKIVEPRPDSRTSKERWVFCVRSLLAYTDPRIGTFERVVEYGLSNHPDQDWWTYRGVRDGIAFAREHITNRAKQRGCLIVPAA